jgi:hypothetical protein
MADPRVSRPVEGLTHLELLTLNAGLDQRGRRFFMLWCGALAAQ